MKKIKLISKKLQIKKCLAWLKYSIKMLQNSLAMTRYVTIKGNSSTCWTI